VEYLSLPSADPGVTYFVGRNGSGKSRTARAIATKVDAHFLSTDRLTAIMNFNSYSFGPVPTAYKGVPLSDEDRKAAVRIAPNSGGATDELYALREQPDVALRVAAFLKRALGRIVVMQESSGFLDPRIRVGGVEYSLFRDEGHGLRELVVLLSAIYRSDWTVLIVDEPELHLHPSMVRLWITELSRECLATNRRAVVVTHEPTLLRPKDWADLNSIWLFSQGEKPMCVGDAVIEEQRGRVTAALVDHPALVGLLAFAPRPVLVEGPTDVAALTTALRRICEPEVVAQTDLVECGGSGGVALWLEIARKLGIDLRAVADLDSCFAAEITRVMDADPRVAEAYEKVFFAVPSRTHIVLQPLLRAADAAQVPPDSKSRARWLATVSGVHGERREALLRVWAEAGLWLHPQGDLEDVLGIDPREKGVPASRTRAEIPGHIDAVASWCAYELDQYGDLEVLLNVAVESVAHRIMEAQRADPGSIFHAPVGGNPGLDGLVRVEPLDGVKHRITVLTPREFAGFYVDFSRDTPSTDLILLPPAPEPEPGRTSL